MSRSEVDALSKDECLQQMEHLGVTDEKYRPSCPLFSDPVDLPDFAQCSFSDHAFALAQVQDSRTVSGSIHVRRHSNESSLRFSLSSVILGFSLGLSLLFTYC